jgi:hypothetical protein
LGCLAHIFPAAIQVLDLYLARDAASVFLGIVKLSI